MHLIYDNNNNRSTQSFFSSEGLNSPVLFDGQKGMIFEGNDIPYALRP